MKQWLVLLTLSLCCVSHLSVASDDLDPKCMNHGQELPANNPDVVNWKNSTPNQFLARAHVQGTVTQIYPDKNGHKHFEIALEGTNGITLEIVYNLAFGALPDLQAGMNIEGCGDYITSTAPSGPYPASPDGAILHWVHGGGGGHTPHGSNDAFSQIHRHDPGYLVINDKVYGL